MARCVVIDMASRADEITDELKANGVHRVLKKIACLMRALHSV